MPFESEAQRRFFHVHMPDLAKRWESETPKDKDLPEHKDDSERGPDKGDTKGDN